MRRKICVGVGLSALITLATWGGAGLTPSAASASVPPSAPAAPELSPGLQTALQDDLGLTESQARTRLRQETAATRLEPKAKRAARDTFGGAWFDARSGRLVVAVTDEGGAAAVRETGAVPRRVEHSAKELDAAKAAIDARAADEGTPDGVSSWHPDPRSSSVVINVVKGAERNADVREFLADARNAGPITVRRAISEAPQTFAAGTVGGDPYYTGNVRCSIGFSVHGGFVTAGHCGQPGASVRGWDGSLMGQFRGSSFPGNDYAHVSIGHGWWTVPVVLGWGTVPDQLVRGSAEAPIGSSICRSGSTTHWHCGTVLAKNETVNYSQGAVHQMTKTSVCAQPGDSGGSFITGDQAQGVTSGGWGNCSTGGQTWFQPVNEILSVYGLRLHTA
jgi:hypothetical protein